MRIPTHVAGGAVAVLLAIGFSAVPAHATVHEIVAQWCSGHEPLEPHGLSRPGSKNFAEPLNANGALIVVVDPVAETIHITFDYGHRPVKVQPTVTVPIGVDPDTGFVILLDLIEPDPDFPAFQHCPKLNS
ncbi:MAG TPA: hypothetical protein VFV95_14170 [Vicinamibacterales bacterium]|nr:hypothetical protein [Vicinamibacterales bacterium]